MTVAKSWREQLQANLEKPGLDKNMRRRVIKHRGMPREGTFLYRIYKYIKNSEYPVCSEDLVDQFGRCRETICGKLKNLSLRTDIERANNPRDAHYYYWVPDEEPTPRYRGYVRRYML